MSVNLIICTYAAKYGCMDKSNYLRESLIILNNIKTNVDRITIMKPKIDGNHIPYENYYNFNDIDISNIKYKIKIVECENIGISYGQFLTGIFDNLNFDYYIFTEDDYILFYDNFDIYLKNQINESSYLCVFHYKDRKWNLNKDLYDHRDEFINFNSYNEEIINKMNDYFVVPDHSCGIISNKTFKMVLDTFGSLDNLLKLFKCKTDISIIWINQIIFGYIFYLSGVHIEDLYSKNLSLFYLTGNNVCICYQNSLVNIENIHETNINVDFPVFIPREMFYPYYQNYDFYNLKNSMTNFDEFIIQYNKLNSLLSTNLP